MILRSSLLDAIDFVDMFLEDEDQTNLDNLNE